MNDDLPEDQYVRARRAKLDQLRQAGVDPFPPRSERTHTAAEVHAAFEQLQEAGAEVTVAGRVIRLRPFGKATFAELEDASGRLQVFFSLEHLGAGALRPRPGDARPG